MVRTVREFVDLIASGSPKRMLDGIRDMGLVPPTPDTEQPEGEDKGFPVSGTCKTATYPVYVAPATSKGFVLNPLKRVAGAVSNIMPFGADRANKSYLTPAPDLGSWQEISAEDVPGLCRRVMVVGDYEIWVDSFYPGGGNKFTDYTPTRLIADFLLRCDTRRVVFAEAVKLGCKYIGTGATASTAVTPFAILTRLDAAITFNIQTFTWDVMEGIQSPSALHNKSQHRRFAIMAKPGTYDLSGEQIAKLVLSCEDGINKMAAIYDENLESYLSLTRFKAMHPLDTVGVFKRESATRAMVQTIPSMIPTKHHYPVWLHDTILGRWYRLATGFTRVSEDTIPAERTVAGTLCGVYEVVYDPAAHDKYTSKQLAWLASIIMQSQYIPVSDAVIAMRGCMERINSLFAHIITPDIVRELETVPGTRFPDLSSEPGWENQVEATVAIRHRKTSAYRYNSMDSAVTNCRDWPDEDMDISASIAVGGDEGVDPRVIGHMLVALSNADMLYGWENVIAHDDELDELVEPPAACVEFYSHVPHAFDPPIVTSPIPIYLQHGDTIYALTYVGDTVCWGVADAMPDKAEVVGDFFGGTLYCVSGAPGGFTSIEFTDVIRSTLAMFGDFSRAPTVYKYLYTIGQDDSWSRVGEPDSENCIYLASVEKDTALCYSIKTNLWSLTNQQLSRVDSSNNLVGLLLPTNMETVDTETVETMLASLQACLPGLVRDVPGTVVPPMLKTPRGSAVEVENPQYSVAYKDVCYTYDGTLKACGTRVPASITAEQLMELLVAWIEMMLTYKDNSGAYAEFVGWGFDFTKIATPPPVDDIGAFLYFNDAYYSDLCTLGRTVPADFHFPRKDTAPESIGVGLFLECDGYRGITVAQLAMLCANVNCIRYIVNCAERDNVLCPDNEVAARTWFDSRPAGLAVQKKRSATMFPLKERPLIAIEFRDGTVAGWANSWGSSRTEGLTLAGGSIYFDNDRSNTIIDVETAKDIIERCVTLTYVPEEGKYRFLRALKLMH